MAALSAVQIEPTAAIAPSAPLILWSRIGAPFAADDLRRAEAEERDLFEWGGFYRAMSDLPLLRHEMATRPRYREPREWLAANESFRRDVLDALRDRGPLHAARRSQRWASGSVLRSPQADSHAAFVPRRSERSGEVVRSVTPSAD